MRGTESFDFRRSRARNILPNCTRMKNLHAVSHGFIHSVYTWCLDESECNKLKLHECICYNTSELYCSLAPPFQENS